MPMPARLWQPSSAFERGRNTQLVNYAKKIVADAADDEHRRDGPEYEYRHVYLLQLPPVAG